MGNAITSQIFAEDLVVGQAFVGPPRAIGEERFGLFARHTGDNHPIHYDGAFAANTRFGRRVAHGLLLMSMTALGASEKSHQLQDAMVALAERRCRFLKACLRRRCRYEPFAVVAIDHKPGRDTTLMRFSTRLINNMGEVFLDGEHTYLLGWRRAVTTADHTDAA